MKEVFIELAVSSSAPGNATIASVYFFYSPKCDGGYATYSFEVQIVVVEPG